METMIVSTLVQGIGDKRGLVVFNFDDCNVPQPSAPGDPSYFQHGLAHMVTWRHGEALLLPARARAHGDVDPGDPSYFQHGLASLVSWREEEAVRRLRSGAEARDLLPVIVVAGDDCSRMTFYRTAARRARVYDVGVPILRNDSLFKISKDAISRIARGTSREVPRAADEVGDCLCNSLSTAVCVELALVSPESRAGRLGWQI